MAEVWKHESGKFFEFVPGQGDVEISEERARGLTAGSAERFLTSALGAVIETGAGAAEIFGVPGAREVREAVSAEAEPFRKDSLAGFAGQMAPFAAGFGVSGTVKGLVATEAAIGAAQTPENPLIGGGLGAAGGGVGGLIARGVRRTPAQVSQSIADTGARASTGGRGVQPKAAQEQFAQGQAMARANNTIADAVPGQPIRESGAPGSISGSLTDVRRAQGAGFKARVSSIFGQADPPDPQLISEGRRLGVIMTPADRSGSKAAKQAENAMETYAGGRDVFERRVKRPNQVTLNKQYLVATGFADNVDVAPIKIDQGAVIDRIERDFARVADAITPFEVQIDVEDFLQGINLPDAVKTIQGVLDSAPTGKINGSDALEYLSALRRDAVDAFKRNETSAGDAIFALSEVVEDQMIRNAKPGTRAVVEELRRNWRVAALGDRGSALTEAGDLAIGGVRAALRGSAYTAKAFRRGRSFGGTKQNDFVSMVRVMAQFRDAVGNSGTAARSINWQDPMTYLGGPLVDGYLSFSGIPGGAAGVAGAAVAGGGIATATSIVRD